MSKLYFAKFLAVEGEIKEGDLVMTPDGKVYRRGKFGQDTGFSELYNLDGSFHDIEDIFKKVKLFLCSRGIQAGDTVTDGKGNYNRVDNNPNITGLEIASRQGWFKVIGEISHEAVWVKDGDEFDETEVRFMTGGYHALSHGEIEQNSCTEKEWLETKLSAWGIISKYIEIQCPTCKQYH